jgi:hypothetical protein
MRDWSSNMPHQFCWEALLSGEKALYKWSSPALLERSDQIRPLLFAIRLRAMLEAHLVRFS